MKLQGRNLAPNLRGDDVTLLQSELRQIKLTTQVVDPGGFFGSTTFLAVQEFQRQHGLPVTGVVDARTASYINRAIDGQPRESYLVKGRVLRPDGEPVPRAQVRAFEKHIRREVPLGEDTVDPLGYFEISYPVPEQGRLSLVVRAFDVRGAELAFSPVICDAKPVEIVDLVLGNESFRGLSEFKRLQDVLMPVLNQEHVALGDLTESDVSLLACQLDLDAEHLAYFVVSARLANETDLPAEWFYALVRQGLPTALAAKV